MMKKFLLVGVLTVLAAFMLAWAGEVKQGEDTVSFTTSLQAGRSEGADTVHLFSTLSKNYTTIYGDIVLSASPSALRGYGLQDSGYINLYATYDDTWLLIESDSANALPCSLHFSYTESAAAGNDTLIREGLTVVFIVSDSLGDSVATFEHDIRWDFLVR